MNIKRGIVCKSKNNVIGHNGKLPWRCPTDMTFFKAMTSGPKINLFMGGNTYRSIPNIKKFIEDRVKLGLDSIYVLTSDQQIGEGIDCVHIQHNPEHFRIIFNQARVNNWVIGGSYIYDLLAEDCDEFYVTTINEDCVGDSFFELPKHFSKKLLILSNENLTIEKYIASKL